MADKKEYVESCKHSGDMNKGSTLIRCLICTRWFHAACVGIPNDEAAGAWTCVSCRESIFSINILRTEMFKLHDLCENILCAVQQKDKEITELNEKLADSNLVIQDLRNENAALSLQLSQSRDMEVGKHVHRREAPDIRNNDDWITPGVRENKRSYLDSARVLPNDTRLNPKSRVFYPSRAESSTNNRSNDNPPLGQGKRQTMVRPKQKESENGHRFRVKGSRDTSKDKSTVILRAAPRAQTFRLSYVDINTDCDTIKDYITSDILEDEELPGLVVSDLKPPPFITHPSYKCYTISVSIGVADTISQPEAWPSDVVPTKYRRPRQETRQSNN